VTREVRSRLGESLESIEEADFPVVQVATSSWEALQYLTMGNMKWQQAKYEDAAAMFELALQKDPKFMSAKGSLGLLLVQFLGNPEQGKRLLAEALDEGTDLPEREYLMIKAVNRQFVDGDPEGALEQYELISELYPDMMQPYNNAGRILSALGRLDEAAAMYETAAEVDQTDVIPLGNLFWLRLNAMRQPRAAEAVGRRRLELAPADANFRHQLGWSLVAQQRFDDALPELRRVLADEPRHPYALPNTAHVLYVTRRTDQALPLYRQMLRDVNDGKMQGSRTAKTRDLALGLFDAGMTDEANDLVEAELELLSAGPAPATTWDFLSRAQLNAIVGSESEAERLIAGALALGPLDANGHMELAQTHALLGRNDEALGQIALAYEAGYWDAFFPLIIPAFRSLHADPRFIELFATES
jgi:tetratricopeptide (TPR) repeat protein